MKRHAKIGAVVIAALLAVSGCGTIEKNTSSDWREEARRSHDPLLDAPHHAEMVCTSEAPVTVLQRFKEIPFACSDLGVSAKIDELRDAGWRIVSLDIGEDIESDNHVGFPVTLKIRKLF